MFHVFYKIILTFNILTAEPTDRPVFYIVLYILTAEPAASLVINMVTSVHFERKSRSPACYLHCTVHLKDDYAPQPVIYIFPCILTDDFAAWPVFDVMCILADDYAAWPVIYIVPCI